MTPEILAERLGLTRASEVYQRIYNLYFEGKRKESNDLFGQLPAYGQAECYNSIANAYGHQIAGEICR